MTEEQAATLKGDDVIEYGGVLHRLGTVVVYRDGESSQVIKVAARSLTVAPGLRRDGCRGGGWIDLVPLRNPGEPLAPDVAARLAAARLVEKGQERLLFGDLLRDVGRAPGVPARPVD